MLLMRQLMFTLYFTKSSLHPLRVAVPFISHRPFASGTIRMSTQDAGLTDIGENSSVQISTNSDPSISTSWKQLIDVSIAKSRKIRGANFVQVATVDETTMEPRCRTIVFRGFQALPSGHFLAREMGDGTSCVMRMIADNRSSKVRESAACEMLWWFAKTSEQYRIRGKLIYIGSSGLIGDEADKKVLFLARKEQWGNLSDTAREQFFWNDPGINYSGEATVPAGGRDAEGTLLPPPDSFVLMFLLPHQVDYLRLGENYRQVDELKDGVWYSSRVNP